MKLLDRIIVGTEYQISLNEEELKALTRVLSDAPLARSPECLIDMCRWFERVQSGAIQIGDES